MWHDGTTVVVVMDFFDAFVCVAAGLVVGERAERSVRTLGGVELVVEFVPKTVERRAGRQVERTSWAGPSLVCAGAHIFLLICS